MCSPSLKTRHVGLCIGVIFFIFGCKSDPVGPLENDTAPTATLSIANPNLRAGETAHFATTAKDINDNAGLDSLVLVYGDGSRKKWTPGASSFADTAEHAYSSGGTFNPAITAYDKKGQTGVASTTVVVQGNNAPTINTTTLNGVEGIETAVALKNIASDAENDPLTTTVAGTSAGLEARVVGDSLKYKMTNPDANGAGSISLSVSDGHNVTNATIPVAIAAMDRIAGRVHDILEGTYIAGVNPSLVMPGPFAGYVMVDGNSVTVNSDGTFAFANKLPAKNHAIQWFIYSKSNPLDSSFVARDTIAAGDRSNLDLGSHTNAGTGPTPNDPPLPLGLLKAYYEDMIPSLLNPDGEWIGQPAGILIGANLKEKGNQYIIYLSGKDTSDVNGSGPVKGYTPEMQDTIANRLNEGLLKFLPPENRPQIVKGKSTDALPVMVVNGRVKPLPYYGIGFRQDDQIGLFYTDNASPSGERNSCVVTLYFAPQTWQGGFSLTATIQEWFSWIGAPSGGTSRAALYKKTNMIESESEALPFVGGADKKELTLYVLYKPLDQVEKYFYLP
jgi:hypothetical protein